VVDPRYAPADPATRARSDPKCLDAVSQFQVSAGTARVYLRRPSRHGHTKTAPATGHLPGIPLDWSISQDWSICSPITTPAADVHASLCVSSTTLR